MTEQTHEQARAAELAKEADYVRYNLDTLLEAFEIRTEDGTFERDSALEELALSRLEEQRREYARAYTEHRAAQIVAEWEGEPNLTYEQCEKLARLMLRVDALMNTRTFLEDLPDEVLGGHERWVMVDAICDAHDAANEEVERYRRELGGVYPSEGKDGIQVTEQKTVFAEVLAELMQNKGIDPTPEAMRQLVERSGLDWAAFEARLASSRVDHPGGLGPLADELALDKTERDRLACAFAFERRLEALL